MPMFEYRCTRCGHEFEELVFGDENPVCRPAAPKPRKKLISAMPPFAKAEASAISARLRAVFRRRMRRLFRRQLRELPLNF